MINKFTGIYDWLSNFWAVPIEWDGLVYRSVECAYQASKTNDRRIREHISTLTSGAAKRFGQTVDLHANWENAKYPVMLELVRRKFQDPELREFLIATGKENIVEGNSWGDRYWGVYDGVGENHLGRILMQVRDELNRDDTEVFVLSICEQNGQVNLIDPDGAHSVDSPAISRTYDILESCHKTLSRHRLDKVTLVKMTLKRQGHGGVFPRFEIVRSYEVADKTSLTPAQKVEALWPGSTKGNADEIH